MAPITVASFALAEMWDMVPAMKKFIMEDFVPKQPGVDPMQRKFLLPITGNSEGSGFNKY